MWRKVRGRSINWMGDYFLPKVWFRAALSLVAMCQKGIFGELFIETAWLKKTDAKILETEGTS
jgi:hypothetical protein